jgi:hypothetical protein
MAFASSFAAQAAALSIFLIPPIEKLSRNNHVLWKAQVLAAIKGAQLDGFIEPTTAAPDRFLPAKADAKEGDPLVVNLEYSSWVAKDQTVLSYLLSNLGRDFAAQVSMKVTATSAWAHIEEMFASQSRARLISTRMALATTTKVSSTMNEYFMKMKSLADDMASVGKRIEDDQLVAYILTGLNDPEYDSIVTGVSNRTQPISIGEMYSQLVSHEQRVEMRSGGSQSSANVAAKGNRNNFKPNQGSGGRPNGGRGGFNRGPKGGRTGTRTPFPEYQDGVKCQICGIKGHPA